MKKVAYILTLSSLIFASCENKKAMQETTPSTVAPDSLTKEITVKIKGNPLSTSVLNEKFTDLEGNTLPFQDILSQHQGKVTIIDIWASWCPDCIKGFPKLRELQEQFPGANYLFLSLDKTTDKWKNAIEVHKLKGSHYHLDQNMKDSFGKAIGLDWIPRYMVLNEKGEIIWNKAIVADDPELIQIIKKATS